MVAQLAERWTEDPGVACSSHAHPIKSERTKEFTKSEFRREPLLTLKSAVFSVSPAIFMVFFCTQFS